MNGRISLHQIGVAASILALMVFFERTLLDWAFVPEIVDRGSVGAVAGTSVLYVLLFGGWMWSVVSASQGGRIGLWSAIGFSAVLSVALSLGTAAAFCPSPCRTIWPLLEITNWLSLALGLVSVALLTITVLGQRGQERNRSLTTARSSEEPG